MMLLGSRCLTQTRYRAIEIPTPRGLDSFSTALNNQGEIVGYYYTVNPPVQTFFTYQDGVLHFLDTTVPGYTMYNASGINDKGQIAFTANIDTTAFA